MSSDTSQSAESWETLRTSSDTLWGTSLSSSDTLESVECEGITGTVSMANSIASPGIASGFFTESVEGESSEEAGAGSVGLLGVNLVLTKSNARARRTGSAVICQYP